MRAKGRIFFRSASMIFTDVSVFYIRELFRFTKELAMKKVALAFTILFGILTFAGAGYVLLHHGQVSAGYACVPMVLTLAAFTEYKMK